MWSIPKMYVFSEAMALLDPNYSKCVKNMRASLNGSQLLVECTLPLDVETAVGLQILGDQAVADPNWELTILARLGDE